MDSRSECTEELGAYGKTDVEVSGASEKPGSY